MGLKTKINSNRQYKLTESIKFKIKNKQKFEQITKKVI
jgi:hypothetical protein